MPHSILGKQKIKNVLKKKKKRVEITIPEILKWKYTCNQHMTFTTKRTSRTQPYTQSANRTLLIKHAEKKGWRSAVAFFGMTKGLCHASAVAKRLLKHCSYFGFGQRSFFVVDNSHGSLVQHEKQG